MNYFCHLLSVHGIHNVRQTEMHTAEPLAIELSSFEVEIASEKLERYKSLFSDQIAAELIQAGHKTLHFEIHKCFNSIWNKEELLQQWKEFIIVPVYKMGDNCDIIIEDCIFYQLLAKCHTIFLSVGELHA
jgi:hypothetical protein